MTTKAQALDFLDTRIATKRRNIASMAGEIAEEMQRIASQAVHPPARIERGSIASLSAQLDGEIGELAGLILSRAMVETIEK